MLDQVALMGTVDANDSIDSCSNLIISFESLIRSSVVAINQSHRNLQLKLTHNDTQLHVEKDGTVDDSISQDITRLIKFISFKTEFVKNFHETILQENYNSKYSKIDRLRNEKMASFTKPHTIVESTTVKPTSTKDKLLKTNKKLTGNLIKSNQYLQSSILQSDLNLDELKQQTLSLNIVNNKYEQFGTIVDKTTSIINQLNKSSNQEKRNVYLSLAFLCCCCSWVLWRRILKIPTKLFIWLLFKFFKSILLALNLVKSHAEDATSITTAVDEAMQRILTTELINDEL
ncbi:hypothetical protein KAFR_0A08180 [Kazachstania africana CBS 2517]|uniref:Sec20 C-terminal domain-containing protein n=1 Tax=Kazachstania africana (strain ATCC 22294 / BCRC 22015 / CBS 2517 / CECT 1963 / NBRC 1671 / NRRL Y-8276) TaxID=1071382 RepID=H2APF2_KAZAF|nr:hypothetical protein KAFR_0A08180 [Kazachstania africana CBS 2517]CCF56252.1 hypothetical protein KAFR_0A08180 [Kazachstania africana CBS 2517]